VHSVECDQQKADDFDDAMNDWADDFRTAIYDAITTDKASFIAGWILGMGDIDLGLDSVNEDVPAPPLLPGDVIGATERDAPPEWEGDDFGYDPPEVPGEDEAPEPEELWGEIVYIQGLLNYFYIGDFMTGELWNVQVAPMLEFYEFYLDFIRSDLSFQFMENVFMLFDVRSEYVEYLSELRLAALESERDVRYYLQGTLYEFFNIVSSSEEDTYGRLGGFVAMMPESRTAAGINQNLVNFTVAPFEFIAPLIRADLSDGTITVSSIFELLLWIAIIILAIAVIIAVTMSVMEYVRKARAMNS